MLYLKELITLPLTAGQFVVDVVTEYLQDGAAVDTSLNIMSTAVASAAPSAATSTALVALNQPNPPTDVVATPLRLIIKELEKPGNTTSLVTANLPVNNVSSAIESSKEAALEKLTHLYEGSQGMLSQAYKMAENSLTQVSNTTVVGGTALVLGTVLTGYQLLKKRKQTLVTPQQNGVLPMDSDAEETSSLEGDFNQQLHTAISKRVGEPHLVGPLKDEVTPKMPVHTMFLAFIDPKRPNYPGVEANIQEDLRKDYLKDMRGIDAHAGKMLKLLGLPKSGTLPETVEQWANYKDVLTKLNLAHLYPLDETIKTPSSTSRPAI